MVERTSRPSNFFSMGRGCSSRSTFHLVPPLPGTSPKIVKNVFCVPAAAFSSLFRAMTTLSWEPGRNFAEENPRSGVMV